MSDSKDTRLRAEELFKKLDKNKDGRISVAELSSALRQQHKEVTGRLEAAERVIRSTDTDDDMSMNFEEFLSYVTEQDKKLKLAFSQLDRNKDNKVDAFEVQAAMRDLGIVVSIKDAEDLLAKMDKDGSLNIDFQEFRDFLLLTGKSNISDIFSLIRHASSFDIGEGITIPDDYTEQEKKSGVAMKTLISGGVAGSISRTATAPLDRLKVLWQANAGSKASHGAHSSMTKAMTGMIKEGGVSSLWRGNGVNCLKIAPESALKFLTYESYKKIITGGAQRDVLLHEKFVAGALAGATAQTIIYPMEVLKTRMCLRKTGQYSSIFDCAVKVYKEGGLRIFYRGYVPNIIGILPYAGIDLALYETFKQTYNRWYPPEKGGSPPIYFSLGAGAASSVCGQCVTYPLALVRTKLQAAPPEMKKSLGGLVSDIIRNEGPTGLYRGIGPNMLKVIPAVSISYAIFEQMRGWLGIQSK